MYICNILYKYSHIETLIVKFSLKNISYFIFVYYIESVDERHNYKHLKMLINRSACIFHKCM